jgi:hypothetical protein
MVCSENGTFTDITIPSVMVPKSAGDTLEASLLLGESGELLISSFCFDSSNIVQNDYCFSQGYCAIY